MKKVVLIFVALLCILATNASKKGKKVYVRRSARCAFASVTERRAPAREIVSLYQEETILHVNFSPDLLLTITFKDEEDNILSQTEVSGEEIDVEIPSDATIVEVCYNSVELVGMLY